MMKNIFAVVFILSLIIISTIMVFEVNEEEKQNITENYTNILETKSKIIDLGIRTYFSDLEYGLKYLSQHKDIIDFNENGEIIIKNYFEAFNTNLNGLARVSKDGILQYTYPDIGASGEDVSKQEHNNFIITKQKPIISDVIHAVEGYNTIVFAYPIFKDSVFVGAISALIPFYDIAKYFMSKTAFNKYELPLLVNSQGTELYCLSENHIGSSISNTTIHLENKEEIISNLLSGEKGSFEYTSKNSTNDDIKRILYYYPIELPNTKWIVAYVVEKNAITQEISSFRVKIYSIFILLFLAILLLLIVLYLFKQQSDKNIKEKEFRFKAAAEQTGQILYDHNLETGKINWSGDIKEITGYDPEEFENVNIHNFLDYVYHEDREPLKAKYYHYNQFKQLSTDYRIVRKDNTILFVESNAFIERNKNGKPINILGTIKDISSRKKIEQQLLQSREDLESIVEKRTHELKQINETLQRDIVRREKIENELLVAKENAEKSERVKSDFLAQMSHEIRTPVNTILNYLSLIKIDISEFNLESEDLNYSFKAIERGSSRLIRTIDMILNMSDLEHGTYELHPEKIDIIEDVLEPLYSEFYSSAQSKNLEFTKIFSEKHEELQLDKYTVTQIFANIIDNAIKYTEMGFVIIETKLTEDFYKVIVSDSGIGISDEYKEFLFNKFSQEEQGYTRKFEGNGLGLALVKKYCDLNNATIFVESEKGKGSRFIVAFKIT